MPRAHLSTVVTRPHVLEDARAPPGPARDVIACAHAAATRHPRRVDLCTHRDHIELERLPDAVDGCEECLAMGTPWLHLRICLECGHVGCCDNSPERHATAHAKGTGHPLVRSLEPKEEWAWCYVDGVGITTPEVRGSTRIPPSPLGR
jgi:hypothetical protein